MRKIQEFYVRVATDRPVTGTELLSATLGLAKIPCCVQSIEFGDVENSPAVWEDALRRFAKSKGLQLVEVVHA